MAAFSDAGSSRKRIATYGKAVRKRPPDNVAFKALQDFERSTGLSKVSLVTSASTESIPNDVSPSPSLGSSTKVHIFDVSSSDDDNISTTPQKKRKLVHVARDVVSTSANHSSDSNYAVPPHALEKAVEQDPMVSEPIHERSFYHKRNHKEPSKQLAKVQSTKGQPKLSQVQISGKTSSIIVTRGPQTGSQGKDRRPPNHSQQESILSNKGARNRDGGISSYLLNSQDDRSTTHNKIQTTISRKPPSRPTTPKAADTESHNNHMTPSASSILTPRGIKMWNDLLGEDNKDPAAELSEHSVENLNDEPNVCGTTTRQKKLPRRRLIDTLVEQSRDSEYTPDLMIAQGAATHMDLDLTQSLRNVDKKGEQPIQHTNVQPSHEETQNLKNLLGQGSQNLGAKITYSRQRSMLAEQDTSRETDFNIPLNEGAHLAQLSNRRVLIPDLVPLHSLHENIEAEDGSIGVAIRTIHELRHAGAESRFKDEVEDLLDRIGKPAPENTTRRSGLMEMAERMRDKLFHSKFVSNGLDQRLFLHLGQEQDVISGFMFISILIPVLESGITSIMVTQLRRQGITRLLIRLMSIDDSILTIARDRKTNMSKSAQAILAEQQKAFLQLRMWDDLRPKTISPRTASLLCLELMIRQSREAGDTGDIISKELISNLFTILKDSYDNKATMETVVDFQLTLSTLVSHSLNPMIGIEEYLPVVRDILESTMQTVPEDPAIVLLLRLALNTTNNSPAASDAFASPGLLQLMSRAVIEKFTVLSGFVMEDKRLVLVDNLVLNLVVLINIVELSTHARRCFLAIKDNSLEDLVRIFQDNIERAFEADSVEDSHLNVAGGYLAVLLGCLSLSPELRDRIQMRQRTASLQPLITCIDEFISHHKKVDALLKDEGEQNTQGSLTDRLQILVDGLRAMGAS